MKRPPVLRLVLLSGMAGLSPGHRAVAAPVDFGKEVQPLLTAKCVECHGAKKSKGDLRLDTRAAAQKGGESGPAYVAGDPAKSPLLHRVDSSDPDEMMPPKGDRLTAAEKEALKKWIAEGAVWPDALAGDAVDKTQHWAFKAPVAPPIPVPVDPDMKGSTPVDAFVAARLEAEKLTFSPTAEAETLCRRIYLDLIGLPPTAGDVDAFRAAAKANGVENAAAALADRLLANPHFGEKWARHWLDAARYADSDGFEKDKPRYSVWNYRDWVIQAFNDDKPYDRFITEQLAGDLLPETGQAGKIALGFLRNSMINEEGGVDPEQFRMDAMFDRMDCVGKAVLGLTIQCAQCHNHKYDPLTQDDYYRMFAFLNNDDEAQTVVYSPGEMQKRESVRMTIRAAEAALAQQRPDWREKDEAAWEKTILSEAQPEWATLTGEWEANSLGGQKYMPQPDGSYLCQGYAPTKHSAVLMTQPGQRRIEAFRLELLTDANLPCHGPGRSFKGTGALTEFEVQAPDGKGGLAKVKFTAALADFADAPDSPLESAYDDKSGKKRVTGPVEYAIDGKQETAWGIDAGPGRRNQARVAIFVPEKPIEVAEGASLNVVIVQNHGGWNSDDLMTNNLGRIRLSTTAGKPPGRLISPRLAEALAVPRDRRSEGQWSTIFSAWRASVPEWAEANAKIETLWKQWPEGSTQLTFEPRNGGRKTHVLKRGDWLSPAREATAGVPVVLHQLPKDAAPTRLTFARWLTARESPTTARVFVNRVWQQVFGAGLHSSPEDFGTQSEKPSHPELLDWLAVDFMEHGWSVKHLLRQILNSRTYRQSSHVSEKLAALDPYNRLLARGPRFRVEAEIVRDVALASSGLLNDTIGGPSVMPPAPADLFKPPASYAPFPWVDATGPDRYRRALYTFRRRSTPYPMLQAFDAPNGDQACIRRTRSNTPLQALTTLNEDLFVDCARALGRRMIAEGGLTTEERIRWAFRTVLGRSATDAEVDDLLVLAVRQRARIAQGKLDATELSTGKKEPLLPPPHAATPADLAAATVIARVLLNTDEAISKE